VSRALSLLKPLKTIRYKLFKTYGLNFLNPHISMLTSARSIFQIGQIGFNERARKRGAPVAAALQRQGFGSCVAGAFINDDSQQIPRPPLIADAESDLMDRILVIDDEPSIADLIREALTRYGYTVRTASNGRQGLQLLRDTAFDLVVTDMCMPDLDGTCIVRHVRGSSRPLTPVIGISGTPWLLEGADCDAILPKPFSLQALVDTVKCLRSTSLSGPHHPNTIPTPINAQPAP
jgi:CheY-like chemotaxis protein